MNRQLVPSKNRDVYAPNVDEAQVLWDSMEQIGLDPGHLRRNRIVTANKSDPLHKQFDMLRTRLLLAMRENGWSRVAVTAPTEGCGSSFVASNLAISFARMESLRTILLDMNLSAPSLSRILGVSDPTDIADYLRGHIPPEDYFLRAGRGLALGLNETRDLNSAELFQEAMMVDVLAELQDVLAPDVVIYDLPPVLESDELLSFLPNVDGVLLVVGGGQTQPQDVLRAEQALGDRTQLLGVVLNKSEGILV
ncbi:MAG: CpsD/CapB family tyrosine-protein kinase [Cognatishimia sp.]|nr:CpsD/CapB family tyrosine-protein kinase [Cognatishimia sp.]